MRPIGPADGEYPHSKPRPPRGWSYPRNRTALDAALAGLSEQTIRWIEFVSRHGPVLCAHFVGETSRFWAGAGQVSIEIWTVPSGERKESSARFSPTG